MMTDYWDIFILAIFGVKRQNNIYITIIKLGTDILILAT